MDSPERLAEAAWIHKLGPEAETLFTKGSEPFVRSAVVDPIVSLLRAGQSVALVGPTGVGKRSLALSLRRSDAWSDESQPTLSFDVPMAHPQSWPVYCTTTRHWIAGSFYVGNLDPLTLPAHPTIKSSTLRAICTQARIPREEFLTAYRRLR